MHLNAEDIARTVRSLQWSSQHNFLKKEELFECDVMILIVPIMLTVCVFNSQGVTPCWKSVHRISAGYQRYNKRISREN